MKITISLLLSLFCFTAFSNENEHDLFQRDLDKRQEINEEIYMLQNELSDLKSQLLDDNMRRYYEDDLSYLEIENQKLSHDIENIGNNYDYYGFQPDSIDLAKKISRNKNEISTIKTILESDDKLLDKIGAKEFELTKTKRKLTNLEMEISLHLDLSDQENWFKSILSWIFCFLILIVIVGFFWITYKKDGIAKNIFMGDHGIQFITLFLLIISIILFGIMGVLEGRELGALIGGISGYILGRSGVGVPERAEEPQPSNE